MAGAKYYYWVKAYNYSGNSPFSNMASGYRANGTLSISGTKVGVYKGESFTLTARVAKGSIGVPNVPVYCDDPMVMQCGPFGVTDINGNVSKTYSTSYVDSGNYAFRFYGGSSTAPAFMLVAVRDLYGGWINLTSIKVTLGPNSSLVGNNLIYSDKNGGSPLPTAAQMRDSFRTAVSFTGDWAKNFVSNPATDVALVIAISCVLPEPIFSKVVCGVAVGMVVKAGIKSFVTTLSDKIIDKMSWSTTDKNKAKAYLKLTNCVLSVATVDPTGVLNLISAFGTGWECGQAAGMLSKDSKGQVTGIELGGTTKSGSSGPYNSALVIKGWTK